MKKIVLITLSFLVVSPMLFAQQKTSGKDAAQHAAAVYTCPMHPEVKSDKPGKCPKCGMNLVPAKKQKNNTGAEKVYTCPMHPEVKSNKPGKCPKCGMELVEKKPGLKKDTAKMKM